MASKTKSRQAKAAKRLAVFDIADRELPKWIDETAFGSSGYPYDERLKREAFEDELRLLQIELLKLQHHIQKSSERIAVIFEGRDAAGKGTCIGHFMEHLNPRQARVVALTKPTDVERGQWYFQRYAAHLPPAGQMTLFDRSWYNRAGVERVMGFCTLDQHADFLRDAPQFEELLVRDGLRLFKFYLEIGREMQLKRFHERRHDPVKQWKITDIDLAAMSRYDDYTRAKEEMFRFTHTSASPWTVILANDQRRARLESIRAVLAAMTYAGKDAEAVATLDAKIVGTGPGFFCPPTAAS